MLKRILTIAIFIFYLMSLFACNVLADVLYEDLSKFQMEISYQEYLAKFPNLNSPDRAIIIPGVDFIKTNMTGEILTDLPENEGGGVKSEEEGYLEWEVFVEEPGLYNLALKYYPLPGKGNAIEREVLINGKRPFEEAKYLIFYRIWGDAELIKKDNQGNELRPQQKEFPVWQEVVFKDSMGYYQHPYKFYFHKGRNTIRLISRREPMAVAYLKLFQVEKVPFYKEIKKDYLVENYQPAKGVYLKLQERDSQYRSSSTLYPFFDQGDPTMEPYDPVLIRLNTIGGWNWESAGEWISWNFTVPEDGLYKIAIKSKQNMQRGSYSNRKILLDGKVPFAELEAVRFPYSSRYQMTTLKPAESEDPYLFYLEKGEHRLTIEVVLGDMVDIIRVVEDSLYELNNIYRQIIMITSATPDPIRTYQLEKRIPDLLMRLNEQSQVLKRVAVDLEEYTGQRGGMTLILRNFIRQLDSMAKKPDSIPGRLGQFRDNLAGLGGWLLDVSKQPLQIDYLIISSPEMELPRAKANMREILTHEIRSFLASFTHNYKLVGDVYRSVGENDKRKPLIVWMGIGRDQAQILKRMIENDFTPKTGIPVNLELVDMTVLLPATLAGTGPEVALSVPPAQPINFALRGAVVDLTDFPDFPQVANRFKYSAIVPFMFRDSVFGIPEQQPFPMLFYRKDILKEKGLELPKTWEDVLKIIAELQKDNMNFGLPFSKLSDKANMEVGIISDTAGSLLASSGPVTFMSLLYQSGVDLFIEDGLATNFDCEEAVAAFTKWTDLYELYDLPLQYDAANRFRTGEMPLIITGYTFYNILSVFAPELRGKWGFTVIPGTYQPDGIIDRSVPAGSLGAGGVPGFDLSPTAGRGCIILKKAQDKEAAWEFIKWWTSADVQLKFGRELESLMGTAARYPTANIEAMKRLPWSVEDYQKLAAQWQWVKGIPEIPGGYMIGRYLDNSFRQVVYHNKPARDTLLDYNRLINEEIKRKRKEFGLATSLEELPPQLQRLYWVEKGGQ